MIPHGYEAVSLVEALNGVSCLPGPGRASSRSVRAGRGGGRALPETPSPANGLGVQPPQRSASALTAISYGTGTETYATIGPDASSTTGLPYGADLHAGVEVPERGGRESVNTAAATGTGSIVSSITPCGRAGRRAPADARDIEYDPEDQQTRSGSPAASQFTSSLYPGEENNHAGKVFVETSNFLFLVISIEEMLFIFFSLCLSTLQSTNCVH